MAFIRRANVILEVKDDETQYYLDLGYDVINEAGDVLIPTIPTDFGILRTAYIENQAEIKALKAEIANLKSEKKKANSNKK